VSGELCEVCNELYTYTVFTLSQTLWQVTGEVNITHGKKILHIKVWVD